MTTINETSEFRTCRIASTAGNTEAESVPNAAIHALTASDGKFGFNLGAGVGFPVGPKTKLNLMGNYHTVSTPGNSTNYMNIRAGLGLSL